MKELTKCPNCGRPLVSHEQVHAVSGGLYCSKSCAINYIMNDYLMNAKEMAIETYNAEAEIVSTEDILKEDLQEVAITVTCTKIVRLPVTLSEQEAIDTIMSMYHEGLLVVEADDCDTVDARCTLVSNENSVCDKEVQ